MEQTKITPTIRQMIYQSYETDIRNSITSRRIFLCIKESSDALAHAISCVATIFAFSAGFFNYPLLSFASGVSGAISLALLRYSVYAKDIAKEKTLTLNNVMNGNDGNSSNDMIPIQEPHTNPNEIV